VAPELAAVVGRRLGLPFGRRIAGHAFARMARHVGRDPRESQPSAVVGLLEDVPLLLVHGGADRLIARGDAKRLVAAAPEGTAHLVIDGADHGRGHATDPGRYEAAVTGHLRAAFTRARP
jgi:alpha-beta hydrolase superfamily lysophospholipase